MKLPFDGLIRRRIYLMRHGDVAYFGANGQRVSDPRLVDLTDRGRNEALAMRDMLSDVKFDRAISSGLPRTIQTGAIVLGGRTLTLEADPRLEEIHGGPAADRAQLSPQDYAYAMFRGGDPAAKYAAGENIHSFFQRVCDSFDNVISQGGWRHLLIAAHGGVNRVILCRVLGLGPASIGQFEQDTGCLNVIDVDTHDAGGPPARAIIRAINVTPEDPAKSKRPLTTMERLALQAFPHLKAET
jgi:broad specificity phosphatase PhoE